MHRILDKWKGTAGEHVRCAVASKDTDPSQVVRIADASKLHLVGSLYLRPGKLAAAYKKFCCKSQEFESEFTTSHDIPLPTELSEAVSIPTPNTFQ